MPAGVTSISTPCDANSSPASLPSASSASMPGISSASRPGMPASAEGRALPSSASAPPSTGFGPRWSSTRRRRPRPPGNRCSTSSSKFERVASKVSSKAAWILRSVSRISPWSSVSAVSRSVRWVSRLSTWASACSYSRSASGLTGPSCSRRRPRRSSFASISARSSAVSSASAAVELAAQGRGDPGQLGGRLGPAVAEVGGPHLGLGDRVGRGSQLRLQLGLLARAGAQLLGHRVLARSRRASVASSAAARSPAASRAPAAASQSSPSAPASSASRSSRSESES